MSCRLRTRKAADFGRQFESTKPTPLNFRDYLQQKRLHLKYLVGKLAFKLRYWSCELLKPSCYIRRLYYLTLRFHGMEIGILRQYSPRPVQCRPLPASSRKITSLPTIAIVTPSCNQSGLIPYPIESVLGQNYPNLEYGVVDGESTTRHLRSSLLRFLSAGVRFYRAPYFLACFRIHNKQKTLTLLDAVGANEKARLIAREHPSGCCQERTHGLNDSYRRRSSLCATLLKCGIRY